MSKFDYKPLQDHFDEMTNLHMRINTTLEQIVKFIQDNLFKEWFTSLTRFEQLSFAKYSDGFLNSVRDQGEIFIECEYLRSLINTEVLIGSVTGDDYKKYSDLRLIEFDGLPDALEEIVKSLNDNFNTILKEVNNAKEQR